MCRPFITSDGCLNLTVGTKEGYSEGERSMYGFPAHTHCLFTRGGEPEASESEGNPTTPPAKKFIKLK